MYPNQTHFYSGKVRDVYTINDQYLVMVASNRISAFDHILPQPIPYKGQVLNLTALHFLQKTAHIVPNWLISSPHPNVSIGQKCTPYKVEMVVRAYLAGHSWRTYQSGGRLLCGVALPDGLHQNDPLPQPIITPTTKADFGHDIDISKGEILAQGIVSAQEYEVLERYSLALFTKGTEMAAEKNLILVDTKYEFGKNDQNEILLIDEIHTPDSSRYFYKNGYEQRQKNHEPQLQLSKEFVREWLIDHQFQGLENQTMPTLPPEFVAQITSRYIELYETITGNTFEKEANDLDTQKINEKIVHALAKLT